MGPSRQVREGRPGPRTHSPVPRVRATGFHSPRLPLAAAVAAQKTPLWATHAPQPPAGRRLLHRVTAAAPGPRPAPPPAPPHTRRRTGGWGGQGAVVGFLPGGRTWRGPPRHGLLRHPQEAPSQGRRGAAPGPLKCLVGVLLRRRRLSQPQQHGGSGHTERAPDPEPGRKRGRARTLGPSALGREKRAGPSRVGRGGA